MDVLSFFSQTMILLAVWVAFKPVKLNVSHRINSYIIYFFLLENLLAILEHFFHIKKKLDLAYSITQANNLVNKKLKEDGFLLYPSSYNTIHLNNFFSLFFFQF